MSKKKKEEKNVRFLNGNYALIPVLFVMCIIPLLMRLYVYDSGLETFPWYPDRDEEIDVFLHCKAVALTAAAVVMAVILAYCVYEEWRQGRKTAAKAKASKRGFQGAALAGMRFGKAKWIIPLAGFGLLALLSTLFSQYRSFGFSGVYEQFESVWVVLGYCIATAYTFYFVRTKEDIDVVRKGLFVVLAILGALGISQLTGHDFWETGFGKSLYVPGKPSDFKLTFNYSGSGNHQVYLTFYNPNYVGVFAALVLPVSVMLCVGNKKWQKKLAWGVLSIVIFLCALGSGSKAFLLSLIATALMGIVFYGRKMMKYLPIILMYGVTILYVGSVYMNYVNIDVVQYVKNALTPRENVYAVEDFVVSEDSVALTLNGETIFMLCEPGSDGLPYFQAWDVSGNGLVFTLDDNSVVHFEDERFAGISVTIYGGYDEYIYIAEIRAPGGRYGFAKGSSGYVYMNFAYRPDKMVKAEAAMFENMDSLFSGRGYLWSRSIPLLKKYVLLGSGADTFIIAFPQNDYVARTNTGYQDQLISKPHSMYLQIGVQYGVVALLCFFAFAILYAAQAIRLCWKSDFKDVYSCLVLGMLMGIVGYGIMGISNDSCVALAPLAWVLLGLGFAVNQVVEQDMEERNAAEALAE